jgi:hypothetical protein
MLIGHCGRCKSVQAVKNTHFELTGCDTAVRITTDSYILHGPSSIHGIPPPRRGRAGPSILSPKRKRHDPSFVRFPTTSFILADHAFDWSACVEPSGGASGQATDISIHAKEILRIRELLTDMYAEHCSVTGEERVQAKDRFGEFLCFCQWRMVAD